MANFGNKPLTGWIHPDSLILKQGATYNLRYIGCLEVKASMKSLDFKHRSGVAKLCINKVCEAAGVKTIDKKRRIDKKVLKAIAEFPQMKHAGMNVNLRICSSSLTLTSLDTGEEIASHDMPRISFASGGDTDTLDFVAYIAKDANDWRACYVLECGGGLAKDVISTIAQAFELRYKQHLKPASIPSEMLASGGDADKDYYNDLPGKVPPDVGPPPVPPLPTVVPPFTTLPPVPSPNLIDLNSELLPGDVHHHEYVNDSVLVSKDVFDMQPFSQTQISINTLSGQKKSDHILELEKELWFHGQIDRATAENLLQKDGDFLVRESPSSEGQYVLSGMQDNTKKHLLLIDPEGVVRTKDRMFNSVSHLINYHRENALPIISAESALVLRTPIIRPLK